jgi:hypothetical protein
MVRETSASAARTSCSDGATMGVASLARAAPVVAMASIATGSWAETGPSAWRIAIRFCTVCVHSASRSWVSGGAESHSRRASSRRTACHMRVQPSRPQVDQQPRRSGLPRDRRDGLPGGRGWLPGAPPAVRRPWRGACCPSPPAVRRVLHQRSAWRAFAGQGLPRVDRLTLGSRRTVLPRAARWSLPISAGGWSSGEARGSRGACHVGRPLLSRHRGSRVRARFAGLPPAGSPS